jgi:hypothetical protein
VNAIHRASPTPWYHEGAYIYDAENHFVMHFAFPYPSKENMAAMLEAVNKKEQGE